ncbi:MAG TPA: hypothetical protein VE988_15235 [Gemmataceae bacterium]|nr:hypothetical protein [Gemmataceae bacterium]
MQRWTTLGASVILLSMAPLPCPATASAQPFVNDALDPTLVESYKDAQFVLYGYFADKTSNDFVIEKVLKNHDVLKGKTVIALTASWRPKNNCVVFCETVKGVLHSSRAEDVLPTSPLLDYLPHALKLNDEPPAKRLRFYFDFLNSTDAVLALDAHREFARAKYADCRDLAKKLPAKQLVDWLKDPKTRPDRLGLYSVLLGHCGNPKADGALLRSILDDPNKLVALNYVQPGRILAGYILLQPKEGWDELQIWLKNDKEDGFNQRYAAYATLRFFWESEAEGLSKKQILEGTGMLLRLPDVADFAIDALREWKQWDRTDEILGLYKKQNFDNPIVSRAILRFALSSPAPRAAQFVTEQRKRDPEWVSDTEELLRQMILEEKAAAEAKKT